MGFTIGSVISGTMREEDLIPAFTEELARIAPNDNDNAALIAEAEALEDYGTEESLEVLEALFEALAACTPQFVYFGAHLGDGADYGFWVDSDSLDQAIREDWVLRVSSTSEVPEDYRGIVAQVSDHGNLELYQAEEGGLISLWAIV